MVEVLLAMAAQSPRPKAQKTRSAFSPTKMKVSLFYAYGFAMFRSDYTGQILATVIPSLVSQTIAKNPHWIISNPTH